MRYKSLGKTGVMVSPLCFGTMSFGGIADVSTSANMFHYCRDKGINFFDCADVYEKGKSEEILGKLISDCRDEVFITSKVYFGTGPDINARGATRYHIVRAIENSLKRLNTDYIDLYFIHRFDDKTPIEETLCTLNDLVRQGKVLYLGASNFAAWQITKALGISGHKNWSRFECIQPMYNLVKRQAEVEILPMAQSENLGVISYSPLGGGLLSGKYHNRSPEEGRLLVNRMYQVRYGEDWMPSAVERFLDLAKQAGIHPVTLAIQWVAHHPGITAPIIGARNMEQLKYSISAMEHDIADDLYAALSSLTPEPPPATDRNEERTEHNYGVR
ncbi:MAG: aldo/keto reductase [Saprospiraceae bacterium]|nr:aldo/keto reductase [Saprospiraceae bacterium]